jgi:hypothetical protein
MSSYRSEAATGDGRLEREKSGGYGVRKLANALIIMLFLLPSLAAVDFDLSDRVGIRSDESPLFTEEFIAGIEHAGDGWGFISRLSLNDLKPYGVPFHGMYYGPFSLDIMEAGTYADFKGLTAKAGILSQRDIVTSPYSLFINGRGLSAPTMDIGYKDAVFEISDRWIGLNLNSAQGWPDRGAVQKNYTVKFKEFRFGFQDVAVFSSVGTDDSRYFDLTYFLVPLPSFFVQYVASAPGRPWSKAEDDNSIMGFFADYSGKSCYAYAQILVDDFNSNRFWDPSGYQNPDKLAWSIGGRMDVSIKDVRIGEIGAYHAGATAYAFESAGAVGYNPMYGYSYYPSDTFASGSSTMPISIEDNMVGYQHGENNIAFLLTWKRDILGADASARMEFTLSGSKSAGNPWHEYVYYNEGGEGTRMLNDAVLEKKLLFSGKVDYPWKDFVFSLDFSIGGVWNRLSLRTVESTDASNTGSFYSPSGESAFLGSVGVSASWKPKP